MKLILAVIKASLVLILTSKAWRPISMKLLRNASGAKEKSLTWKRSWLAAPGYFFIRSVWPALNATEAWIKAVQTPRKSTPLNLQKQCLTNWHPAPYFAKDVIWKSFKTMEPSLQPGTTAQPSRTKKAVPDAEVQSSKLKKLSKRAFLFTKNASLVAHVPDLWMTSSKSLSALIKRSTAKFAIPKSLTRLCQWTPKIEQKLKVSRVFSKIL